MLLAQFCLGLLWHDVDSGVIPKAKIETNSTTSGSFLQLIFSFQNA
jgi:hypothetical protein